MIAKTERVTIKDLAEKVGLSYATVSRALNNHPCISLTTVSQDIGKTGSLAATILIRRIEGRSSQYESIVLKPDLIIRKSCGYGLSKKGGK